MSYYIITYEVPIDLLEKLKTLAPDFDQQENIFYEWKKTIPQVETSNVMEAPFRAISSGKVSMDFEPDEHEKRFYELFHKVESESAIETQKKPQGNRRSLSAGYPGISDYQEPEEVALAWKRIEKVIAQHPEYAVADLLAADPSMEMIEILADPSPLEEWIRFYYGCAMRGSATITIDC
jgi:hypothetical protein